MGDPGIPATLELTPWYEPSLHPVPGCFVTSPLPFTPFEKPALLIGVSVVLPPWVSGPIIMIFSKQDFPFNANPTNSRSRARVRGVAGDR